MFQHRTEHIDLTFVDVVLIQSCEVYQSSYRHIRIIRALMFIQIHCTAEQKGNIIFYRDINHIFQCRDGQLFFICILGIIQSIVEVQQIFSVRKYLSEQGIFILAVDSVFILILRISLFQFSNVHFSSLL